MNRFGPTPGAKQAAFDRRCNDLLDGRTPSIDDTLDALYMGEGVYEIESLEHTAAMLRSINNKST